MAPQKMCHSLLARLGSFALLSEATSSAACARSSLRQYSATISGPSTTNHNAEPAAEHSDVPHVVLFGGRGFVGSHIAKHALDQGLHVISISRSGTPPAQHEPWMQQVEWIRGDALEPRTYSHVLQGALAAISAVGAFGTQEQMFKFNGTANITAVKAAHEAGVPRFVYISAHIPNIPGIDMLLRGYVEGKQQAEAAVRAHFPAGGVCIRPGVIYGPRVVSHSLTLPLQYLFQPLESALGHLPNKEQLSRVPLLGALTVPPTDVRVVAAAAVQAATDPSVPAGVIDVWDLPKFK